jgi:hypothetical protein
MSPYKRNEAINFFLFSQVSLSTSWKFAHKSGAKQCHKNTRQRTLKLVWTFRCWNKICITVPASTAEVSREFYVFNTTYKYKITVEYNYACYYSSKHALKRGAVKCTSGYQTEKKRVGSFHNSTPFPSLNVATNFNWNPRTVQSGLNIIYGSRISNLTFISTQIHVTTEGKSNKIINSGYIATRSL